MAAAPAATISAESDSHSTAAGKEPLELRRRLRHPIVADIKESMRILPSLLGINTGRGDIQRPIGPRRVSESKHSEAYNTHSQK